MFRCGDKVATTSGIRVTAKKRRSIFDKKPNSLENKKKRQKRIEPTTTQGNNESTERKAVQSLRSRLEFLEQENRQLRTKVEQLEASVIDMPSTAPSRPQLTTEEQPLQHPLTIAPATNPTSLRLPALTSGQSNSDFLSTHSADGCFATTPRLDADLLELVSDGLLNDAEAYISFMDDDLPDFAQLSANCESGSGQCQDSTTQLHDIPVDLPEVDLEPLQNLHGPRSQSSTPQPELSAAQARECQWRVQMARRRMNY